MQVLTNFASIILQWVSAEYGSITNASPLGSLGSWVVELYPLQTVGYNGRDFGILVVKVGYSLVKC